MYYKYKGSDLLHMASFCHSYIHLSFLCEKAFIIHVPKQVV